MAEPMNGGGGKPVCRFLRTKAAYVPGMRADQDYLAESHPTATYWCLRTLEVLGPDDTPVSPEDCKLSRVCFEAIGATPVA
jgi:hypothetical protein